MDEHFLEQLKELRCGPCASDRGVDKLAHVVWFLREGKGSDAEVVTLPLCLECTKMVFSRFDEPIN
jgi:hypothetical protein